MENAFLEKLVAFIYFSFGIVVLFVGMTTLSRGEVSGWVLAAAMVLEIFFTATSLVGGIGLFVGRNWGRVLLLVESGALLLMAVIGMFVELASSVQAAAAILSGIVPLGAVAGLLWELKPTRRRAA